MTPEQHIAFAADIAANTDQTIVDALADGALNVIMNWYNEKTSDFWVLQQSIEVDRAVQEGIDWDTDYAAFDEKDMSVMLFLFHNGSFAIEAPRGRHALNEVCTGAANSKAGLLGLATRKATKVEKLFAEEPKTVYGGSDNGPGGGDGSAQAQSAVAVFKGNCTLQDVQAAIAIINQS